jgi:hypothetical protein
VEKEESSFTYREKTHKESGTNKNSVWDGCGKLVDNQVGAAPKAKLP